MLASFEEGYGQDFFGIEPKNLYHHDAELDQITRYLQMMTRFNVWCEAILELRGNFFIIKNTRINPEF